MLPNGTINDRLNRQIRDGTNSQLFMESDTMNESSDFLIA